MSQPGTEWSSYTAVGFASSSSFQAVHRRCRMDAEGPRLQVSQQLHRRDWTVWTGLVAASCRSELPLPPAPLSFVAATAATRLCNHALQLQPVDQEHGRARPGGPTARDAHR